MLLIGKAKVLVFKANALLILHRYSGPEELSAFGCQRDLILNRTYFTDLLPHHFTNNNQMNWLYWTCNCLCCNGLVSCLSLLFVSVLNICFFCACLLSFLANSEHSGCLGEIWQWTTWNSSKVIQWFTYMVLLLFEPGWCFRIGVLIPRSCIFDQILLDF